jgi:hypothetical protein
MRHRLSSFFVVLAMNVVGSWLLAAEVTLETIETRRGEVLTGVVIDEHVHHLVMQFYHDGQPMGSRRIKYSLIKQRREPSAQESAESGYPSTRLPNGTKVARPYDSRDPESVLARMRSNQAAMEALTKDNDQLLRRYLDLIADDNSRALQDFWQWAQQYTAQPG